MATEREQMSKMNEDAGALQKPITYNDILGAGGKLGSEPVLPDDAALMQSAETRTFGQTQKNGAASIMQAAAQQNVSAGLVQKEGHSQVAEEGVAAQEIRIPGVEVDVEYVAGQPIMANVKPTPVDSFLVAQDAVTIGEALEAAAVGSGHRPVEDSDARAIQSAMARATGAAPTTGSIAAAAMSAAELNSRVPSSDKTTLADLLMDATIEMEADKVVTQEDATKVLNAELRGSPTGEPLPGGVAAAVQAAADINERAGLIEPASGDHPRAFPFEDTPVQPLTQDSSVPESRNTPKPEWGEEKATSFPTPVSREGEHAKED